jgi:hypothetical protein
VLAYKARNNEILAIECKSFIDSPGVSADSLKNGKNKERYKLFNDETLREVVLNRLKSQLIESGSCAKKTKVKLCLAAGNVVNERNRGELLEYFNKKGWGFYSDIWVKEKLIKFSSSGYENEIAIVTTKILTRKNK